MLVFISSAKSNSWTPVTPLNIPRHQLGVTELNGKIFAVGGSDGKTRLNTVEYFSPIDDDWKYAKSLTTCRSGVGVCSHSGFLYSFGGYDGHLCLSSVERYDPELDIWISIPPMSIARSFPGTLTLVEFFIHVFEWIPKKITLLINLWAFPDRD